MAERTPVRKDPQSNGHNRKVIVNTSQTVAKKKPQLISTNSRESHKETNKLPKTHVPQSQNSFPMGLTSVSDKQELLLSSFSSFYSNRGFLLSAHQAALLGGS